MAQAYNQEPLLTPSEVAAMFRVNPKTVTRWARAGKITAIRTLGGHRRFRAHKAINIDSGFSLALNNLGSLYEKANLLYKSEFLYEKAVQNDPDNGYMWINLWERLFYRGKNIKKRSLLLEWRYV